MPPDYPIFLKFIMPRPKIQPPGAKEKIVDFSTVDPPGVPEGEGEEVSAEDRGVSDSTVHMVSTAIPTRATHANTKAGAMANRSGPTQKKASKVPPVCPPRPTDGEEAEQDIFDRQPKRTKGSVGAPPLPPNALAVVSAGVSKSKRGRQALDDDNGVHKKRQKSGASQKSSQSKPIVTYAKGCSVVLDWNTMAGIPEGVERESNEEQGDTAASANGNVSPDEASPMSPSARNEDHAGPLLPQCQSKSVGHFSEDARDVETSLLGPGLPEEETESISSPRVLGEGLSLSDEEIQSDSGPGPLTLDSRAAEEGGMMGSDGGEVDTVPVVPLSPTGLIRGLRASQNKDMQWHLEKERAALLKLSTLSALPQLSEKGPRMFPIAKNAHTSLPEGIPADTQGTEGPGTGGKSTEHDDAVENSGGDIGADVADKPGDAPSEYLTTAQEKVVRDAFWKSTEDLTKTMAEELNVTTSVIFRRATMVIFGTVSKQSSEIETRTSEDSPLDMETMHTSYKAEMKKAKDRGGEGRLSKWRTKIKEEAKDFKQETKDLSERAHVLSNLWSVEIFSFSLCQDALDSDAVAASSLFSSSARTSEILEGLIWQDANLKRKIFAELFSTYVDRTESSSDDPVVEWERVKARINGMQGAQGVQAALRTAASKAWCDLLSCTEAGIQDIYVIQNFPDDVPFLKMETLNTPQRWALLQACVVGLVEKVGAEITKETWLKEYDDEGLVTTLSGQAVLTFSMTNAFRKEQAAMAKAKAKDCGTGSPTTYLKRGPKASTSKVPSGPVPEDHDNSDENGDKD
ncbi:hypothetical protein BS47DRAFT_1368415 [Hydnum rufescens UP504]|uniref:Uncharacterized protein n=1 Tax=Hydnum rufescens UP504 TaxID=1448309 RepID=A0A9P6DHV8_9AGAM|nr:hypothetical protein BS47DRAFT_1368415 [Hydnum rufescens UP504]